MIEVRVTTVLSVRYPGPGVVGRKGECAEVGLFGKALLVKGIRSRLLSRMRSAIAFWVLPAVLRGGILMACPQG